MIPKQTALLNNVPQGAYVVNVIAGSPAEKAGLEIGDIIFKVDSKEITQDNGGLAKVISGKKPGDVINLDINRNGDNIKASVTLSEFAQ